MVIPNDESRLPEMAAQLFKNLWIRVDEERRAILLSHLMDFLNFQTALDMGICSSLRIYHRHCPRGFIVLYQPFWIISKSA